MANHLSEEVASIRVNRMAGSVISRRFLPAVPVSTPTRRFFPGGEQKIIASTH